jgi:hypothetical protein
MVITPAVFYTLFSGGVVTTAVTTSDSTSFADYGVLGLLAIVLIAFARTAYKRETVRADNSEAEVRRLNTVIQEKYVPALEEARKAAVASMQAALELQAELKILRENRPTPRKRNG